MKSSYFGDDDCRDDCGLSHISMDNNDRHGNDFNRWYVIPVCQMVSHFLSLINGSCLLCASENY